MSHEGFTEDDQARIAQDLISRALGKGSRKGLGFGTDEADEEKEKDKGEAASGDKEKTKEKKRTREHREGGEERRPRSRSRERRRSRSRSRGRDRRGSRSRSRDGERDRKRSRRSSSRSRSRERRKRRDKDKGRSRSRSGSRSRASSRRSRSRERSRSRDRRDDARGKQEKVKKTKAEDGASAQSQPQRQSQEGDPQAAVQSIAERIRKKIEDAAAASQTDGKTQPSAAEPSQPEPVTSSQIQPAGLAEVIARLREKARGGLQQATSTDSDLQRTTTAGKQWERPEMTQASQFFKNEEVRETGTTADLDEQARRQRYIAAVEDEKVETLDGAVPVVKRPQPAVAQTQRRPREEQGGKSGGVGGGGVRTGPGRGKNEVDDDDDDDEPFVRTRDLPLWKRLKAGDVVEAKYSQDGKWYKATVKHVIHGGYPVAKYGVHYSAYGNEEEVSWRDIKLVEPADTPSPQRSQRSRTPSRSPSPMRGAPTSKPTSEPRRSNAAAAPVELEQLINPALLNNKPGMSWKERAAAQRQALVAKSRSSGGDGSATNGAHAGGMSCSEVASQIEKALDENKVNAYLTDKKRDKMQLNMKKSTTGRNFR